MSCSLLACKSVPEGVFCDMWQGLGKQEDCYWLVARPELNKFHTFVLDSESKPASIILDPLGSSLGFNFRIEIGFTSE